MKLLFDENLSPRLVEILASKYPDSAHVNILGMQGVTDLRIWDFAKESGLVIVSKDNDFRQRTFLFGPPPKVIWLSVGNAPTTQIADALLRNYESIARFIEDPDEALLVLGLS